MFWTSQCVLNYPLHYTRLPHCWLPLCSPQASVPKWSVWNICYLRITLLNWLIDGSRHSPVSRYWGLQWRWWSQWSPLEDGGEVRARSGLSLRRTTIITTIKDPVLRQNLLLPVSFLQTIYLCFSAAKLNLMHNLYLQIQLESPCKKYLIAN